MGHRKEEKKKLSVKYATPVIVSQGEPKGFLYAFPRVHLGLPVFIHSGKEKKKNGKDDWKRFGHAE